VSYYSLLRIFQRIRSRRLKLLGLYAMHILHRRYLGMFIDPVMACNIRCQMCAFSSDTERPKPLPPMPKGDVEAMARTVFPDVMKLQVGCGAEPTLYKDLAFLIRQAKQAGVPYVSLTTNGQLLTPDRLRELAEAGLNEVTLSTHGLLKDNYERLMTGARFAAFTALIDAVGELKKQFGDLKLRINYTVNADNYADLGHFAELFGGKAIDIVQIRPVQDLGDSAYRNFNLQAIAEHYDEVFSPISEFCEQNGITLLYPSRDNLTALDAPSSEHDVSVQDFSYCYCYTGHCLSDDFDFRSETYRHYCRRTGRGRKMLLAIIGRRHKKEEKTVALNYSVR